MSTSPRSQAVKRDWGHDETGCTVLHIDMDAFYASCEIARHPELKGKPVIIGTGERSVVSAASYEARIYGINSAMPVATAKRKCPNGIYLPVDMTYYRSISHQIFDFIGTVTDQIEQVSVDEAYVDVSGALLQWKQPTRIAAWIREQVRRRFNVTCSVGIAANKLIAKLASTNAKPDGMLLIPLARHAEFIRLLPLRSIPGVGPAAAERFRQWGIDSVAQLAELSEQEIAQITGSKVQAHTLWRAAQGQDERIVVPYTPEKSIGAERTFHKDTVDRTTVLALMRHCSDDVAASLRKRGLVARTVTLKVRFADFSYSTKALTLPTPTNSAAEIFPIARDLLAHMLPGKADPQGELPRLIRLAGVSVSNLSQAATTALQPALDFENTPSSEISTNTTAKTQPQMESSNSTEKLKTAEKMLDSIRHRYGKGSVHLGL